MGKTIILIHGRAPKPTRAALKALWLDALEYGLQRDYPKKVPKLSDARIEFVYYGDISNAFLVPEGYDVAADKADRRRTLKELKQYKKKTFFDEQVYNKLPHKSATREFLADAFAGILSLIGLSDRLVKSVAPDMKEYWNLGSNFGSRVRFPMIAPLKKAMDRDDDILVIGHSLGSVIAYDTFWKFSRLGEYRPKYSDKPIDLFLSIGSPLADEMTKKHLKGARAGGARKYPSNIRRWVNVAAEDDYISHDQRVANDYQTMLDAGLVRTITDHRIYNLAVREGKSNPHHGAGYLIHPVVSKIVAR